ncbi:restriction endonuclease subunit S [Salicibibacter kimchii]|uniref:Restriction endonuclease subunit S n=1 Tax=Salicibibacter kimchii TaxID=2099786 RepID=A0A345BVQ4_9BACI|nr:restriction endonuclease subunit S [Salicibibacter kimchii]AXF55035.1 restriction endonuclease subunit S [Salicibibacter kimchii]
MSEWKRMKWGDIASLEYGKALRNYKNTIKGYPVYGTNGQIGYNENYLCEGPGIIIGRKGAYRGVHYSPEDFYVIDTAFYLNMLSENIDWKWAYYELLTKDINSMDSGSAIPSTSRSDFYELPLTLPPLKYQKIVSNILSSLDDKIELNRKMNETLEEMAMTLYKHWFVDFGPFQDGEFVDSELGRIPKGWEVGKLQELYTTSAGGTPSRKTKSYYQNGTINWLKTKELNDNFIINTEEKITEEAVQKSSAKLFRENTVIIAMYGATVGQLGILASESTTNQACCALLKKYENVDPYIGYLHLKYNRENIINLANGGAQQNINQRIIKQYPIIIPPIDELIEFNHTVKTLFELKREHEFQIITLTQARDYLLPSLISGEIDLSEAKEHVEEVLT